MFIVQWIEVERWRKIQILKASMIARYYYYYLFLWTFLEAQSVQNLPAMWEIQVWSLGQEDPWRRERQPTPVFWWIQWAEEPCELQSMGLQTVGYNWVTNTHTHTHTHTHYYYDCFYHHQHYYSMYSGISFTYLFDPYTNLTTSHHTLCSHPSLNHHLFSPGFIANV